VKEGIEGAIFEDEPDRSEQSRGETAAGAESVQGMKHTGGRDREHQSGYGGQQGEPKTSSDQREPHRPD
jgi:hypothetical protein